ncbi:hypothetical protein DSO57_1017767 [Entomophthora muscae]|uniref:Uncharacterized protein n=1 Tax=Entomophthora muscae TaxID=34485 RepID=A0ACC2S6J3_9FUNG|nr:hypothetical protein DSO57_1017767 [Entomophthora muscae]
MELKSAPTWLVDGTFANCPQMLKQLRMIHAQGFASNLLVPGSRSFLKGATCNTGSLGGNISKPTKKKPFEPAPSLRPDTCSANPSNTMAINNNLSAPDARSFPNVITHENGRSGGKLSKSDNENCPQTRPKPKEWC